MLFEDDITNHIKTGIQHNRSFITGELALKAQMQVKLVQPEKYYGDWWMQFHLTILNRYFFLSLPLTFQPGFKGQFSSLFDGSARVSRKKHFTGTATFITTAP